MVTLDIPAPSFSAKDELVGKILSIDAFGNLVTNIDQETFMALEHRQGLEDVVITLGRSKIQGISTSYDAVKAGSPVALFGSRKLLEIAVNQMDARTCFKARVGQTIKVKLPAPKDGASR
jgi:hypothetical protein